MQFRDLFRTHTVSIPSFKKMSLAFTLVMVGCLLFSIVPAAHGFIAFKHVNRLKKNLLILKVDKPQWKIGYRFAADCPDDFRQKEAKLKTAMTTALKMWLKPLHELKPAHAITDDFLFLRQDDFHGDRKADRAGLIEVDIRITFECRIAGALVWIATVSPPDAYIRMGTDIDNHFESFVFSLIHELGHAFGLEDTYVSNRRREGWRNKGGLEATVGTQPASLMAGWTVEGQQTLPLRMTEDDVRGIVWLYKHFHEGLPIEDCFFPDYELEEEPRGCIPKYPLIFSIKHSYPTLSIRMLAEDPKLNVNAQDAGEFAALHYAVMYEQEEVVEHLLMERSIKPFLRDNQGRSALQIARDNKLDDMITLLLTHPLTLPVNAKGKLATTWGHLKIQY